MKKGVIGKEEGVSKRIIRSRKGGLFGQPFVFILVLLVMAFTFLFGFNMIRNLLETQEKVKYVEFKSELTDAVSTVYAGSEGTRIVFSVLSRHKPLIVPKNAERVCFNGNKVEMDFAENTKETFPSFKVNNLAGSECIGVVSGGLSFFLENAVRPSGEVAVIISKNE